MIYYPLWDFVARFLWKIIFTPIYFLVEDLKTLLLIELIDKLSSCTQLYSKSYSEGSSFDELNRLKTIIIALQQEIEARKAGQSDQVNR